MLRVPLDCDPEVVADWIEASLLFSNLTDCYMSDSDVSDAMEDAAVADPEASFADAKRVMFNRMRAIGPNYPFSRELSGWALVQGWEEYLPYSFLLLVSLGHHYSELSRKSGAATEPSVILEHLTRHVVSQYFNGQAIRFGSKRENPIPSGFDDAVDFVATRMRESAGGRLSKSSLKDDGVDVIAWLPFQDKKRGQLAILVQCAIGKNWDDKLSDISIKLWETHILWTVTPVLAIAVPFCFPLGVDWDRVSKEAGIIFDRARLVSQSRLDSFESDLAARIVKWNTAEVASLKKIAI